MQEQNESLTSLMILNHCPYTLRNMQRLLSAAADEITMQFSSRGTLLLEQMQASSRRLQSPPNPLYQIQLNKLDLTQ